MKATPKSAKVPRFSCCLRISKLMPLALALLNPKAQQTA